MDLDVDSCLQDWNELTQEYKDLEVIKKNVNLLPTFRIQIGQTLFLGIEQRIFN